MALKLEAAMTTFSLAKELKELAPQVEGPKFGLSKNTAFTALQKRTLKYSSIAAF